MDFDLHDLSKIHPRIHFLLLTVAIIIAIVFKINSLEWCLLFIVIAMVLTAELFNSAIERLADIVNPDWNKKVMLLKDYSAGAVLVSAIVSIVVGCLIFVPKIIYVLNRRKIEEEGGEFQFNLEIIGSLDGWDRVWQAMHRVIRYDNDVNYGSALKISQTHFIGGRSRINEKRRTQKYVLSAIRSSGKDDKDIEGTWITKVQQALQTRQSTLSDKRHQKLIAAKSSEQFLKEMDFLCILSKLLYYLGLGLFSWSLTYNFRQIPIWIFLIDISCKFPVV